jgi:catechol 2,3-dioxygenase-like lactoylglutathione lyase family enzyme
MDATAIDHVNLRVPADGIDAAREFYADRLGFDIETYEEKPFFDVRLASGAVFHLWPDETFERPTGENYDHVAVRLDHGIDEVKRRLDDAGVEVEREGTPHGATGTAPAVYVTDPFGYLVELKARD